MRILASRGPLPPTIIVTGAGDERTAVEAMKLGASDYIVKDGGVSGIAAFRDRAGAAAAALR
jgi:FixJ family two-component response regulator